MTAVNLNNIRNHSVEPSSKIDSLSPIFVDSSIKNQPPNNSPFPTNIIPFKLDLPGTIGRRDAKPFALTLIKMVEELHDLKKDTFDSYQSEIDYVTSQMKWVSDKQIDLKKEADKIKNKLKYLELLKDFIVVVGAITALVGGYELFVNGSNFGEEVFGALLMTSGAVSGAVTVADHLGVLNNINDHLQTALRAMGLVGGALPFILKTTQLTNKINTIMGTAITLASGVQMSASSYYNEYGVRVDGEQFQQETRRKLINDHLKDSNQNTQKVFENMIKIEEEVARTINQYIQLLSTIIRELAG